jgi:beta-phosphoglucomutase-like phosphatase (HAD superfamily)
MDGLLVDSEPLWFEIERAFCRDRGFDWTAEHASACIGRGLRDTLAAMGQRFGFEVDHARDGAAVVDGFVARVGELRLKPGAVELLAGARGRFAVALASSSPRHLVRAVVDRFDLRSELRAIVTGDDVARPKPAPDIFLRAAAELAVPPGHCAVLEDSLAGVTAGRAAGMTVIAVPEGPWEGRGFEAVADVCCSDLLHAAAWLGLLPAPQS